MKALIFDVFGTLVDWRNSIAFQAERDLSPLGFQTDWHDFADAWRNEYQPAMERVRSGQRAFCKLDILHRDNLDTVLSRLGWNSVDEATRTKLTLAWHTLDAWPEVNQALIRLRKKFLLAPCSNGHIAQNQVQKIFLKKRSAKRERKVKLKENKMSKELKKRR